MSFWAIYVSNAIKYFSPSHVLPGLISFRKSNRFPAAERLQSIEIARKYPVLAAWASLRIVQFPLAGRRFHLKALGRGQSCKTSYITLGSGAGTHQAYVLYSIYVVYNL